MKTLQKWNWNDISHLLEMNVMWFSYDSFKDFLNHLTIYLLKLLWSCMFYSCICMYHVFACTCTKLNCHLCLLSYKLLILLTIIGSKFTPRTNLILFLSSWPLPFTWCFMRDMYLYGILWSGEMNFQHYIYRTHFRLFI